MAVSAFATGTQTSVLGTEHFLSSPNVAGTYTLHVDTNVMNLADVLELRVYQMILTGGTSRVVYVARYVGVQHVDDQIKVSLPIANELSDTNALRFSLKQMAGTVHAYPWKVLSYR